MLVNAIKREKKQMYNRGMRKGKAARSMELAGLMLSNGEPLEKIARYTGLSTAAIQKLKAGHYLRLANPEK